MPENKSVIPESIYSAVQTIHLVIGNVERKKMAVHLDLDIIKPLIVASEYLRDGMTEMEEKAGSQELRDIQERSILEMNAWNEYFMTVLEKCGAQTAAEIADNGLVEFKKRFLVEKKEQG